MLTHINTQEIGDCPESPYMVFTGDRMDDQFGKMKTNFVDKGVPVIIGEFGANNRVGVISGEDFERHTRGRHAYYDYLMKSAKRNKVVPIAWDTGHEGENNMTIIRRQSEPDGSVFDMDILKIMRSAYGLGDYVNNGITHVENFVTADSTTEIAAGARLGSGLARATSGIVRVGNRLESAGEIRLFNVNGTLVRKAINGMSLENIPHGIYIAKGAGASVKVDIQ